MAWQDFNSGDFKRARVKDAGFMLRVQDLGAGVSLYLDLYSPKGPRTQIRGF